jgi:hypothetical protein
MAYVCVEWLKFNIKINTHNHGLKDDNENCYFKLMFLHMQNEEI